MSSGADQTAANSGARPSAEDGGSQFIIVTERGGEPVSHAQLERFHQRYVWAGRFAEGKDVLELACGTGPGLGYLQSKSKSLAAGDIDPGVLALARAHYDRRLNIGQFDAARAPFPDSNFDVVILFEAIYYLADAGAFLTEARRILKPGGVLLLATANKDLFDFNPSPFSVRYYNAPDLAALLGTRGFLPAFFGGSPVPAQRAMSRVIRLVKKVAVALHLIPRSMRAKRLLKRLVFGRLVTMPRELRGDEVVYREPLPIDADKPDTVHQVLYCAAVKGKS